MLRTVSSLDSRASSSALNERPSVADSVMTTGNQAAGHWSLEAPMHVGANMPKGLASWEHPLFQIHEVCVVCVRVSCVCRVLQLHMGITCDEPKGLASWEHLLFQIHEVLWRVCMCVHVSVRVWCCRCT